MSGYFHDKSGFLFTAILSVLSRITWIVACFLLSKSIGQNISLPVFFLVLPLVEFIRMFPISINGIGVREWAFIIYFGAFGMSVTDALVLSILVYSAFIVIGAVGGFIYGIREWMPRKKDLLIVITFVVLSLCYYLSYYDRGLNLLDEGYLLDPIMRVYRGELPYRDFHHFYSPAGFYLFSFLFKLTGANLLAVRLFWVVIHVVSVVFFYLSSRKISNSVLACLATVTFIAAPGVWHKSFFCIFPYFIKLADFQVYRKERQ